MTCALPMQLARRGSGSFAPVSQSGCGECYAIWWRDGTPSRRTTRARRLGSPTSLFWLPPRRLEQAPLLAIGLTPGRRLDLAPPATNARPVGRIAALAHHAFEPVLLRHAEQRLAVIERFSELSSSHSHPACSHHLELVSELEHATAGCVN